MTISQYTISVLSHQLWLTLTTLASPVPRQSGIETRENINNLTSRSDGVRIDRLTNDTSDQKQPFESVLSVVVLCSPSYIPFTSRSDSETPVPKASINRLNPQIHRLIPLLVTVAALHQSSVNGRDPPPNIKWPSHWRHFHKSNCFVRLSRICQM